YRPSLSSSLVGNSRAVRSSVGAGLVWDSILGPLRIDYAYPLSKASYDVTQRVHFGYGGFYFFVAGPRDAAKARPPGTTPETTHKTHSKTSNRHSPQLPLATR